LKWAAPASGSTYSGCKLYKSANQTISNNSGTSITFDSEVFDTDAYHSTSSNTDRITIPSGKGGKYLIQATAGFVANNVGVRQVFFEVNGTTNNNQVTLAGFSGIGTDQYININTIISLAAADYVILRVYQNSGGNLDIKGSNEFQTTFSASLIGA